MIPLEVPYYRGSRVPGFAARLRKAREALGLSQEEFAFRVNMYQNTISGYEMARREPPLSALVKIAQALHVSADWLLGLK